MIRLSAFADEISPDVNEQIAVMREQGVRYLELRSAWDVNVLNLTDDQVREVRRLLEAADIAVSVIGSPVGKFPVDQPLDELTAQLDRAIEVGRAFDARLIRVFSFYPPERGDPDPARYRDEVVRRLGMMSEQASRADVTLLHENDTGLYGDTIEHCVDLMRSVDSPSMRFAFDPANLIVSGQSPYPDGYEALHPWIAHVHVKDARWDRTVVPAGDGEARWPELLRRLRDDDYSGYFSLEPHLAAAGQFRGFSGPDLFRRASQAFQDLLRDQEWAY